MADTHESIIDVRMLKTSEYSEGSLKAKFPGCGSQDFRVYFSAAAHRAAWKHARETTSVEIGGVLVGHWGSDEDGPYIAVTEIVRCDAATSKSGEVTFTHEAWNVVNREMDTRFADMKIVGWYHSHPGFGIFLSERDRFIHEHFFSNPGQIAYVVDPLAEIEGVFAWRGGKPSLWPHFWVGEEIRTSTEGGDQKLVTPLAGAVASPVPMAAPRESILTFVQRAILCALIFMIGFLLARIWEGSDKYAMYESLVDRYGPASILRIGLHENLLEVEQRMNESAQKIKKLNSDLAEAKGEEADKKRKDWNEVLDMMRNTQVLVRLIEDRYGLTQDEEATIAAILSKKKAELGRLEAEEKRKAEEKQKVQPKTSESPKKETEKAKEQK
jgi:proteasome lid subunit RPN8/RPN11